MQLTNCIFCLFLISWVQSDVCLTWLQVLDCCVAVYSACLISNLKHKWECSLQLDNFLVFDISNQAHKYECSPFILRPLFGTKSVFCIDKIMRDKKSGNSKLVFRNFHWAISYYKIPKWGSSEQSKSHLSIQCVRCIFQIIRNTMLHFQSKDMISNPDSLINMQSSWNVKLLSISR